MWDTYEEQREHLSHDMPCQHCGHALHTFLSCDADCACAPVRMPGELVTS
jgi:hypothetical protein